MTNVSGQAKSGTVTAVIGHSSSGKTKLLNILAGRIKVSKTKTLEGTVRVNGQLRTKNWCYKVAVAEQFTKAYHNLTIDEIIQFHAHLKMGNTFSYAEKRAIIDYLIDKLDMNHLRYFRIEGMLSDKSIGRDIIKRITIVCLILELPEVAILDEPTTDMDSTQALDFMKFFKEFCERTGMTAVITFRQPRREIWNTFANVSILGHGHVLFNGSTLACKEHFKNNFNLEFPDDLSPSDLILDFIKRKKTPEEQETLINSWNETLVPLYLPPENSKAHIESKTQWRNSYWREFCLLYSRLVRVHLRERLIILGEVLQTLILALLIAFAYFQLGNSAKDVLNTISLFYFITACVFALVGIPLSISFDLDKTHFIRERASRSYRMSAAFLAKFLSVLPLATFLMLLFSIPIYFICGLSMPFTKFLTYLAILFALRLFGLTLRLLISAGFKSQYSIAVFLPFLVIFYILFGDLKAETEQMTWILAWLKFLSPLFYAVQALMQNEFEGNTYEADFDEALVVDYTYYLDKYDFQQIGIWYCFIALMGFSLLFFVLGYIVLYIRTKTKQILI